jgi:hypothetical protein
MTLSGFERASPIILERGRVAENLVMGDESRVSRAVRWVECKSAGDTFAVQQSLEN